MCLGQHIDETREMQGNILDMEQSIAGIFLSSIYSNMMIFTEITRHKKYYSHMKHFLQHTEKNKQTTTTTTTKKQEYGAALVHVILKNIWEYAKNL